KAAGFTNLSQDHLDYHGDMASYRAAKLRLFEALLPRGATAVLNADSAEYPVFAAAASGAGLSIDSVGENGEALHLVARDTDPNGQRLTVEAAGSRYDIHLPLAGAFQASNALVAAGLCIAVGEDAARALAALEHLQGARGRMQHIGTGPKGGEAFVDYAHTPDGLKTALEALRPHARGRLIVVFGAGGDRDRAKRPLMGAVAASIADTVIVTDDNPRTEDPSVIRQSILAAAPGALEIGDRREAIRTAVGVLSDGDLLVVAGKGHEQSQTIGDRVLPFDDAAEVAAALGMEPANG
ncbi:MAG TPA: UDP-N-acetylmuramoyl-L-alanyl-D-glutamate--2,6-diaminopimelate ligase, partial [Caulobacteraceae bacterium]|nr:UDP-N-acetylmuramoyl-L-alanyl-D-glutamate--2,6-diaminopimelate ligase [Caulobacteraceae bacterium]